MKLSCLVNGVAATTVSAFDRGLQFGDGFFTTIKVEYGQPVLWQLHWQRLEKCAAKLSIPLADEKTVRAECDSLIKGQQSAVVKIVVSRGTGGRGYAPPATCNPTRIVSLHPFPEQYKQWQKSGIHVQFATTRLAEHPLFAGLKTLNRLEQVAVKQELGQQDKIDDLLVLNTSGYVVESSSGNIFWRRGENWYTPDLTQSGVEGVARAHLLELNPSVIVVNAEEEQIRNADELFICNSLMGIVPVVGIGERTLPCVSDWPAQLDSQLTKQRGE